MVTTMTAGMLLIPLAWAGIALFLELRGSKWWWPALVMWALIFLGDLAWTVWLTKRSRSERVEAPPRPRAGEMKD